MRPMMRLVLGLAALALILVGVAFWLPSQVTVARSKVINASEPVVFPYLNNLRTFNAWSPWAKRDPNLQVSFSGPDQGNGARIEWNSSERSVGTGSMQIKESRPNRHIDLVVDLNGLEGDTYYDVVPSGSGSKVVWGFTYDTGSNPFRRWKGLMLDRFVGTEFETGLNALKEKVESERGFGAPPVSAPAPVAPGGAPVAPAPGASAPPQAAQPAPPPNATTVQEQRRPRRP
jgi:hypothetical protein